MRCKAGVLRCHFSGAAASALHTRSIKSDMLSKRCEATSQKYPMWLPLLVGLRQIPLPRQRPSKQSKQRGVDSKRSYFVRLALWCDAPEQREAHTGGSTTCAAMSAI